jgi:hypothetical protein
LPIKLNRPVLENGITGKYLSSFSTVLCSLKESFCRRICLSVCILKLRLQQVRKLPLSQIQTESGHQPPPYCVRTMDIFPRDRANHPSAVFLTLFLTTKLRDQVVNTHASYSKGCGFSLVPIGNCWDSILN